ncbi:AAA-domain-containing protein [Delitschia confertaspora ATCC 74209]|uniref:AAA-domain-containing protein n=1 Tax=Delitschia confertaspora ATCC 74209 TaxID=1513339 RepID=A0A9P4JRL6_9PLEO|nr:AAA-domain-containing protein [Delitschia confertaspora ATCC 74209]
MRTSPASAMQKTYDECYLTCSTAVYFESQNNEAEALRSWKSALDQIHHHNAHRLPPNYHPKSESEKALCESVRQLELQCKERVDLLETLKRSREEDVPASPTDTAYPYPPYPPESSMNANLSQNKSGWLGGGTVPPVDYPDIVRPALPPRPSMEARRSSGAESIRSNNHAKHLASRPTLSPSPFGSDRKVSRTPSPEKKGMLKTLRPGRDSSRSATSKLPSSLRNGRPDAAKAATQAWGITGSGRPSTSSSSHSQIHLPGTNGSNHSQNHLTKDTGTYSSRRTSRRSSIPRFEGTGPTLSVRPPSSETIRSNSTPTGETVRNSSIPTSPQTISVDSQLPPKSQTPGKESPENDRFQGLLKKLPRGVDEAAAEQIMNEIVIQGDEVHWDDIAGLEVAKSALKETVVYPFLRPDLFMGLREPAKGMLLFGPPGTGKTMLARAVATESKSTFFAISASSLTSKFLGESEKLVRALFALARMLAPSIIFVDEIDSLLSARAGSGEHEATRRIKTEFLIQWSDLAKAAAGRESKGKDKERGDASRVLVLAATNLPWAIDEAARRRFVRRQYIPLPEGHVRKLQLKTLLSQQKHGLTEEDIDELVNLTEGFSGSDITALAKDAAMGPLRSVGDKLLSMSMDEIRPIEFQDFKASLSVIRPSVSKQGLKEYEDWARNFGERGG